MELEHYMNGWATDDKKFWIFPDVMEAVSLESFEPSMKLTLGKKSRIRKHKGILHRLSSKNGNHEILWVVKEVEDDT